MADNKVRKGDISTYQHASREFLEERKAELRREIYHPHLTSAEFTQGVVLPSSIASGAIGWSSWQALNKVLDHVARKPWSARFMHVDNKATGFMGNKEAYEKALAHNTKNIATLFGEYTPKPIHEIVKSIIDDTGKLNHGLKEDRPILQNLMQTVFTHYQIPEADKRNTFFKALEDAHKRNPQGHVGQYHLLRTEMERLIAEGLKEPSSNRLGETAYHNLDNVIIGKGAQDNERIIAKYRNPALAAIVTIAAATTLWRGFRSTHKQKVLDMESETSFIDRLLDERDEADSKKQGASGADTNTTPRSLHARRLQEKRAEQATNQTVTVS